MQDAWIRWQSVDHHGVRSPVAYLTTTVTRMSIDIGSGSASARNLSWGRGRLEPIVERSPRTSRRRDIVCRGASISRWRSSDAELAEPVTPRGRARRCSFSGVPTGGDSTHDYTDDRRHRRQDLPVGPAQLSADRRPGVRAQRSPRRVLGIGTYGGNRVKRFLDMGVIAVHVVVSWLRSRSIWKRLTRWCCRCCAAWSRWAASTGWNDLSVV